MAVNEPILRAQPEGEVCLRSHNSLATSESLIYLGHSKWNSCLSGYLLKKIGSVGRLEKENESMNIIINGHDVIHDR